jgi:hypothetical protein
VSYEDPLKSDPGQDVSGPAGPAPLRRPNSIRRTATIDMTWPDGLGTQLHLEGHARDAVTFENPSEPPEIIETAKAEIGVGPNRTIEKISVEPDHPGIPKLVGARGGGHLRGAIAEYLPGERESGHPLYLMLDDVSGCSLIAGFAWRRFPQAVSIPRVPPAAPEGTEGREAMSRNMADICIGWRSGGSALSEVGQEGGPGHRIRVVPSVVNPDDPHGWHELPEPPPVNMRRARRIDAWREGHLIKIDAAFQDSAGDPDHGRIAVHEYQISAEADVRSGLVTSMVTDARILPFRSCTTAKATATWLVNSPLADLRTTVLDRLGRANGCTHLNDALRALAEVPALTARLDETLAP